MRKPRCLYLLIALGLIGLISGTMDFSSAQSSPRYIPRGQVQPPDAIALAQMQQARTTQLAPATALLLPRPTRAGLNLRDYLNRYFPEQLIQPRASFTVNDFFDDELSVDVNPGNGICADGVGVCGLRTAIMEANALPGLDTILLGAGTWTLGRPGINENGALTGDLDITDSLIIQGAGAQQTIINGGAIDRVFHVTASVDFYDLSITNGNVSTGIDAGGGIWAHCNGDVLLKRVNVYSNRAVSGGGFQVGGCGAANVSLQVENSAIYNNDALLSGGGLELYQQATVTLVNSTISQNESTISGSGILVGEGSTLTAEYVTVADNYIPVLGLGSAGLASYGTTTLTSSIVAYNKVGLLTIPLDCFGSYTSGGDNVYTSADCNITATDLLDAELALGELALNAPGTTMTHALLPGASARDLVSPPCIYTEDQRGAARPQGPGCDSGAYEAEFIPPTATATNTPSDTPTATETASATATFTVTATPTDTATATVTPEITETATETLDLTATVTAETPEITATLPDPTTTATDDPGTQLITNSSFEAANLTPWVRKNASKDKRKCNQPDKIIAHSGDCVYLFNGSAQENSKIVQKPNLTGLNFATGDTLDFILFVNANKASSTGKIKLRVVYSDGTPTGKRNATIESTDGYIEISDSYTLESAAVSLIKIQIQNQSPTGKVYIDDVSLIFKAGDDSVLIRMPDN